ncbi:hypothetical protein Tco_1240796, partial [Tanacetum coccineum]
IDMDTFMKLPIWTGTTVSKGDAIPDNQRPEASREKKEQQNLATAQAKRVGEGNSKVTRKKRRVRRDQDPDRSGSKRVLSPAPLHHAAPENAEDPPLVVQDDATGDTANVEREVVDLSGNTRVATPPATINQPSPRLDHHDTQEHHDTHEHTASDVNSFHLTHHEDTEEEAVDHRFVPNWGLRDDLRICTFRAYKELVSHLPTLAEEEFLANLTNVKVVSHAYQSLSQCVLSQGELLKRHEQLNH